MSEANTFDFELVEPEGRIVSGPMWQAVMPGTEGEFGVRAGHCALVASLSPGVVILWRTEDEKPLKIFVAGGFAHVTGEKCVVIVEETSEISKLDKSDIERELKNLEDEKAMAKEQSKREDVDRKLELARAKLHAALYKR
jgi:F-type H+-transporting ATPase subunit epsilon